MINVAAARRVIEPDEALPGRLGPGRVLPHELLTIHGLDLDLTEEQRIRPGREELAASLRSGILFEAILEAGFAMHAGALRPGRIPKGCREVCGVDARGAPAS